MAISENHILDSAISLVSRYGFSRVTMQDLAKEAGVSRQTIYSLFENKAGIAEAAARRSGILTLEALEGGWAVEPDLTSILHSYHQLAIIKPYDWMAQQPDAWDLVKSEAPGIARAVANTNQLTIAAMAERLSDLELKGQEASTLADFVVSTSVSLKHAAQDRDWLLTQLGMLRQAVLALVKA